MDVPIRFILAAVLMFSVQADPTDQGPQKFSESPPAVEAPLQEKKQQKRQQKYEEVILYLTPSQIRAYETGKGLMSHQQAAELRALEEGRGSRQPQQSIQYGGLQADQIQPTAQFGVGSGQRSTKSNQGELRLEESQQTTQPPPPNNLDLLQINEPLKEQMQNIYNNANNNKNLQKEVKKLENKQLEQMQLYETSKHKLTKVETSQQLEPENTPQSTTLELQKREKYVEFPLPQQFIPQEWSHLHQQYGAPSVVPHLKPQFFAQSVPQLEKQLIPVADSYLTHLPSHHEKTESGPQNYAYLYFYPHGKPVNNEESQLFSPPREQKPKELFAEQEQSPIFHFQPNFQLIPYEYGYQNKLEAQQILQAQLEEHKLNAHRLEAHKLEAHQLQDFDAQKLLIEKHLEPYYKQQNNQYNSEVHKYEPQELKLKILPHTAALRAQASKEIKVDVRKLNGYHQQEIMEAYEAQKLKAKTEAEEKEAHRLDVQLKEEELKAERFKAEQIKENEEFSELFNSPEFRDELLKNQDFKNNLFQNEEVKKELFKNQEFKNDLFRNEEYKQDPTKTREPEENIFKNQDVKEELFKIQPSSESELSKSEYQDLGYLQKLEPKRTHMYSILNPLFQGHSITESLLQQKFSFPHHKIHLETGFKPLQYAPKYNDQKYAREVEKILKRNHVEKQRAFAKAAAIANEPPEIIHSEEKIIMEPKPMEVVKHVEVPMPTPVMVPVPTPIEVKVPQPYPVPVEIIRPYPISILKTEKVEVQKPVPIEIEKRVPVTVTKNIYVKVDKPFYVPKVVPVEVKREMPVEVPLKLKNPLKFSIIKHVWE